ncbi:hypothetical protein Forpe1208_v000199 [Fusarium oxysporum f. sp. rapae]|uniref:Uncharacterized protein n=1 Tax=Fusarium oxysporum f. sp. rapae TaxID=485398 RepID=A0A8J5U400_FUSOX|nr:hypothetical protein Forpe1208_v000199 [Fusarium oxysporum f. sp. rapae]
MLGEPVVERLGMIIAILDSRPTKKTHVVWGALSDELQRMLTAERRASATEVLTKLNLARSSYIADVKLIDGLREELSNPATAQSLVGHNVLSWCPQAMARIVRYDASPLPDPDWWDCNARDIKGRNLFSSCLLQWFVNHVSIARAAKSNHELSRCLEVTAEVLTSFMSHQANGPLLNALYHQIEGLGAYIRSNAQGGRLEQGSQ